MNFTLRPWQHEDIHSLVEYANNYKIARFLTNGFPHPYTEENGKQFLEFAIRSDSIFAIDIENRACGSIGLHSQSDIHSRNMELGYWLAEPYWGMGIITEAIKQIVAYGFQSFDINRIFARPFGTNKASQRVLEKAGFELEATFKSTLFKYDEFIDEMVYAIRK